MVFEVTARIASSSIIISSINDTLAAVNHRVRNNDIAFFVDPTSMKVRGKS